MMTQVCFSPGHLFLYNLSVGSVPMKLKRKNSKLFLGYEPPHDKTNQMTFAPSEDSDQPGHPPSLIRVFVVHSIGS